MAKYDFKKLISVRAFNQLIIIYTHPQNYLPSGITVADSKLFKCRLNKLFAMTRRKSVVV